MAIETKESTESRAAHSGRTVRWATGANVGVAVALAVALVAALQWGAYTFDARADLTSTGVNSLSDGTQKLLDSLESEVRLTSLYYKRQPESEAQVKFRSAVADLIELYRSMNPGKVRVEYINPVQDHKALEEMWSRLRTIPKFAEQFEPYRKVIEQFRTEIAPEAAELIAQELQTITIQSNTWTEGREAAYLGVVRNYFEGHQQTLSRTQESVKIADRRDLPDYAGAVASIRVLYGDLGGIAEDLDAAKNPQIRSLVSQSPDFGQYLEGVVARFRPLTEKLGGLLPKPEELPKLDFEQVARQFSSDGNCILVEAVGKDARLVSFADTWPLHERAVAAKDEFSRHEFRGEERISSEILRMVQEQKAAVIFVRHGGPALFFAGMPMGPMNARPPYARMRSHLEDLSFTVHEWDLQASTTPPAIEPEPAQRLYVVLKPAPPEQSMGRPPQAPPFGDEQRRAVLNALGDNGKALFMTGWVPGAANPMMPTGGYEYAEYLRDTWGIDILASRLILDARPVGPQEFDVNYTSMLLSQLSAGDNVMVTSLDASQTALVRAAPLEVAKDRPEGVAVESLLIARPRDGLWAVEDVAALDQQLAQEGHVTKTPDMLTGPFNVATAAKKGDARIVVVSSEYFAMDDLAFAQVPVLTARGLGSTYVNPGNVALFVNALHWLAGNTQWMNLGRPIDMRVIDIAEGPSLTFVKVLSYGIWPALALLSGGIVWMIRRR